nr:hypothetical protein [Anaerolinea thermophila]
MPLFEIKDRKLTGLSQTNFAFEKELQTLIERNLETVFNCRLIQSEFSTGVQHSGRIDTLALSEDNNPVIIEYKKIESSELINQSLYYLAWLKDHKGDFERAVQKAIRNSVDVDWSEIRVICIAPNYKKYDLYAVQMMGANIELWTYHLFDNRLLYLEKVIQTGYTPLVGEWIKFWIRIEICQPVQNANKQNDRIKPGEPSQALSATSVCAVGTNTHLNRNRADTRKRCASKPCRCM